VINEGEDQAWCKVHKIPIRKVSSDYYVSVFTIWDGTDVLGDHGSLSSLRDLRDLREDRSRGARASKDIIFSFMDRDVHACNY